MFKFFRTKKKKVEVIQEEIVDETPLVDETLVVEEQIQLKENEIGLSVDEIEEIDNLISSVKIALEELEQRYEEMQEDNVTMKVTQQFHANNEDEDGEISEEAQESLEFIRENLSGMMKNFVDFRLTKLKEKIDTYKRRLLIWETLRAKIGSKLKLEVNELELPDDALPLVAFLNKITKTLISNPTLLKEDQDTKIRNAVNDVMKQAFNS